MCGAVERLVAGGFAPLAAARMADSETAVFNRHSSKRIIEEIAQIPIITQTAARGRRADGDIRPYGCGERWRVQMGWQGVLRKNIVGDDVLIVPSNHAGTHRRRVKDAAPYDVLSVMPWGPTTPAALPSYLHTLPVMRLLK